MASHRQVMRAQEPTRRLRRFWWRPPTSRSFRCKDDRSADGVVAVEQRDEALHFFIDRFFIDRFFIDHWDRGTRQLRLLVKPEISGEISSPPPELAPMYSDLRRTAVFAPSRWMVKE